MTSRWNGTARWLVGFGCSAARSVGALPRIIERVERQLGGPLETLPWETKQTAVRLLQQRGAFTLRKSVEYVADALGVSRFTVYNYLNVMAHQSTAPDQDARAI